MQSIPINKAENKCASGCKHCSAGKQAEASMLQAMDSRHLVLSSLLVFLLPLVAAMIGGYLLSGTAERSALGVLLGLVAGFLIALLLRRICMEKTDK